MEPLGQFIDGQDVPWRDGETRLDLVDPATGELAGQVAECGDVAAAVDSAARAHERGLWRCRSPAERAALLRAIARALRAEALAIAGTDTRLTGLPLHRSTLRHVEGAAGWFEHFADRLDQPDVPCPAPPGLRASIRREPLGVVAAFTPWNIPALSAGLKAAAALAAGNAVILKPSELAPAAALALARIASRCGLPPGQLNVVQGRGSTVGQALAADARVRAISFTGSEAGGRAIAATAGARGAALTLELGGKSAFILDASADLPQALAALLEGAFANNGQACLAPTRLLVAEPLAPRILSELAERIAGIRLADPREPDCAMGPLISLAHRQRTLERLDAARRYGDTILVGGHVPREFPRGAWFRPALVAPRDNASPAVQEEFFAPVLTLQTFATREQALALAASTRFGLALYVWSEDPLMLAAACAQPAGTICLNTPFRRVPDAPFGGFAASGNGREGGQASLAFFSQEKTVLEPARG